MNSTVSTLRKTTLALAVVAAVCAGSAVAAAPANSSLMTVRHAAILHRNDVVLGALPLTTKMHLVVELQVRHKPQLDAWIANIGKPGHPRIMSPAEWDAKYAPTAEQAQRVVSYLKSVGISDAKVSPDRMIVEVHTDAATASRAFQTSLVQVRTADGRMAYAHTVDAVMPASLKDAVFSVAGLQTVNMGHTFAKRLDHAKTATAHPDAGSEVGHAPANFPIIYGDSSLAPASSVVVGIFTQGSMTQTIKDLGLFTKGNGYATVTTQEVDTDGAGSSTSGVDEWDLDSQDIVAQSGGAVSKLILYQTPSLSEADMDANFSTIVSANAAKIINVSIGGCETSSEVSGAADGDPTFSKGVTQGQTFSISTGDSGSDECSDGGTTPSWPADSQYVVSAAGTDLYTTGSTTWAEETVWVDSGGSESKFEPKPSWQPSSCNSPCSFDGKHKGVADVAFDADPNSGAQLYLNNASPSSQTQVGGTSLAAPLNSGTWARAIQAKGTSIGFEAPLLYAIPGAIAGTSAAFHDVTSGNNGGETAAVGWDLASGLGSIVGSTMIADLGGGSTGGTPSAAFTDTVNNLAVTFTNTSTDSGGTIGTYAWTFGDGSTSSSASPSHTYTAGGTYTVTLTVTDSADGKTSSVSHTVTVSPAASGGTPTAAFTDTVSGLTATFTNGSTDSGGTIGTYAWTFGDGSTSSSASPSHTYAAAGTYTVGLTVTDSSDGKTSTVSHTVTVTSGGTPTQLLSNTGFETGTATPWTLSSGVLCSTSSSSASYCSGETSHAGSWFAWLDGYGSAHTDTVSQAVTIPSGKTTATLQYYLHIDSTKTTAADTFTVQVVNSSGTATTLATYTSQNTNTGYTVHTASLASYIGQKVTIKFTGKETSSSGNTNFTLDDVTLTVQ